MKEKQKILIAGAGIAGLTAAFRLLQEGCDVVVIEKEKDVGGLARTFNYGDFSYDIGPHRFYSANPQVLSFIDEILGEEVLDILRYSAVFYCNRYHTWPLRLKSIFQLPLYVSIPAFLDLFTKSRYKKIQDSSFKNYILGKYGNTLYETFFKGYTEKFLGISPEKVHYHWAKIGVERATIDKTIKTGSISQLFRLMLMPKPRQLNFIYPPGGINQFCEKLKDRIISMGGRVITDAQVTSLHQWEGVITKACFCDESFETDAVIWTATIDVLFQLLKEKPTGLQYLALCLYNIELEKPPLETYQWCYFGNKDIVFSRSTNPAQFDPRMVPEGKGALCVEVTCMKDSDTWSSPEKLKDSLVNQLMETRTIESKSHVKEIHIERVPYTYPIYDIDYLQKLAVVRKKMREINNLFLAGRTGLFWYNNMDHSVENAFSVVEKVLGHSPETAHKRLEDPLHLGAAVGDPTCSHT